MTEDEIPQKRNIFIICISIILMLCFILEVIIAVKFNSDTYSCLNNKNPVCYTDWTCMTAAGVADNTLNSKYTELVKQKNNFLTSVPNVTYPNNNALSTVPYYGCKEPSYNTDGSYDELLPLTNGQTYQYNATNLNAYTGSTTSGMPTKSLYCIPTTGGSPQPTFLPNTSSTKTS